MNCYHHEENEAVSTCHGCGRGLCRECSERFTLLLCAACLTENNNIVKRQMIQSFSISTLFALLSVYVGSRSEASGLAGLVAYAYLGFSLPWAYRYFGRFVTAPYFKAVLALFLGWAIAPFSIYKSINQLKVIQETARVTRMTEGG